MKTLSALCVILVVAAIVAPAEARRGRGGQDHCTDAPRSEWKPMSVVEEKTREMGYTIHKTEISGTCYEVYATKGGVNYELYFNPATGDLANVERD